MKKIVSFLVGILVISQGYAHEGHDKTPGAINAPHGGVIQGSTSLYWELVNEQTGVKLYPLTHDMAVVPLKELTLTGTVKYPKKTQGEAITFSTNTDFFLAKVDAKGAYRYTLELEFIYKGKKEKVKFQLEPQ